MPEAPASVLMFEGQRVYVRDVDDNVEISGPGAAALHQECNALDLTNTDLVKGRFTLPQSEYGSIVSRFSRGEARGAATSL